MLAKIKLSKAHSSQVSVPEMGECDLIKQSIREFSYGTRGKRKKKKKLIITATKSKKHLSKHCCIFSFEVTFKAILCVKKRKR